MKPFPIPVVTDLTEIPELPEGLLGPGSQPQDEEALDYIHMPRGMDTYRPPLVPEPEAFDTRDAARSVLLDLRRAMDVAVSERRRVVIDLSDLDEANREMVNQVLGEGEVSARIGWNETPVMVQESVFAGIWRVIDLRPDAHPRDYLEIGAAPAVLFDAACSEALPLLDVPARIPPDVMNAPSVLAELAEEIRTWRPAKPAHVVNLTLLPLSETDVAFIDDTLGAGHASVLSRGYGNCRIESTGVRCCWRVVYFNSEDAMILNTFEVTDLPVAAQAAPADLADSRERLAEVLDWALQS